MPKKVAYVANNITSIHDRRFLEKLSNTDLEIHAISFSLGHWNKEFFEDDVEIPGVTYYHIHNQIPNINLLRRIPVLWFIVSFFYLYYKLFQIRPHIVHSGYATKSGFLAALTGYRPLISMPWGSDILLEPYYSYIKRSILRYTLYKSDFVCCDCQTVKQNIISLTSYNPERICVFPWGINLDKFQPSFSSRNEGPTVISTRKFDDLYGVSNLVQAIPEILHKHPDTKFILIGNGGSLHKKFSDFINNLGIKDAVEIIAYVENEKIINYLHKSDIYISTSKSDGTSLSLLEAMAVGMPLVVTDIPANKEWVKQDFNGSFIKPDDSKSIVEVIDKMLSSPDLTKKMGMRNYLIAQKKANWDLNFNELLKLYNDCFKYEI